MCITYILYSLAGCCCPAEGERRAGREKGPIHDASAVLHPALLLISLSTGPEQYSLVGNLRPIRLGAASIALRLRLQSPYESSPRDMAVR